MRRAGRNAAEGQLTHGRQILADRYVIRGERRPGRKHTLVMLFRLLVARSKVTSLDSAKAGPRSTWW